jgi:hypothetical protein
VYFLCDVQQLLGLIKLDVSRDVSKAAVFPVWRLIHRYSRGRQEFLRGTGNELLYFASTKQLSGCSLAWTAHDYFLFYILAKTKLF